MGVHQCHRARHIAARELHLTPSAISKLVTRLERSLRVLDGAVAVFDAVAGHLASAMRRYPSRTSGKSDRRVVSVMVEVIRSLYMDERTGAKLEHFEQVKETVVRAVLDCAG